MFTVTDIMQLTGCDRPTIAELHSRRVLPEPVTIGTRLYWREEDVDQFLHYLIDRRESRDLGIDPDSPAGPAPPVYSTGLPRTDPRDVMARIREQERQAKSKTLAAGSQPIPEEKPVDMPAAKEAAKTSETKEQR